MEERDYKLAFAQKLHRVSKELRSFPQPLIAKEVVGKENAEKYPQYVLRIGEEWIFDNEVLDEIDRLDREPIPKEVVIRELYQIANSLMADHSDRVKAYEAIGKMMGWSLPKKDDGHNALPMLEELASMLDLKANDGKV